MVKSTFKSPFLSRFFLLRRKRKKFSHPPKTLRNSFFPQPFCNTLLKIHLIINLKRTWSLRGLKIKDALKSKMKEIFVFSTKFSNVSWGLRYRFRKLSFLNFLFHKSTQLIAISIFLINSFKNSQTGNGCNILIQ